MVTTGTCKACHFNLIEVLNTALYSSGMFKIIFYIGTNIRKGDLTFSQEIPSHEQIRTILLEKKPFENIRQLL